MPDWLTNLFSLSREISSKVALPIFAATLFILALPAQYAAALGIDQFRNEFRIWIGVILIVAAAALVSNFLWVVGRFAKPFVQERMFIFWNRSSLRNLTDDEKRILRQFIIDGKAEIGEKVTSGTINLLERKHVVMRASNLAAFHTTFMYILQPWAREYLTRNKHLLD